MVWLSLYLSGLLLLAMTDLIRMMRPIPVAGALPVSVACWIAFESVLYNFLSLFNGLVSSWMWSTHFAFIFGWFGWRIVMKRKQFFEPIQGVIVMIRKTAWAPAIRMLFPLLILLALTAILYPPNNYDSICYHMARVAHWIQNASISYYPTSIERQNEMGPGAEYLILFFQLLSGTDRLTNFVQFLSYCVILIGFRYLLRILQVSKSLSVWIVVLAASAPTALMQATSTQNDIVAALMTMAIAIAAARFIAGSIENMTWFDYCLVGICLASGLIVKPTSWLAAFPVFLVGFFFKCRGSSRRET